MHLNARSMTGVSLIIPVFNRGSELKTLLAAVSKQTLDPGLLEVLVCDDGSTEPIDQLVDEACAQTGLNIVHIRQENRGPGSTRNLGIRAAKHELLAFTDSDCIPAPDWLAELTCPFADPSVVIVGGRIHQGSAANLASQAVNFLMSTSLGGGARNPQAVIKMDYYPRTPNLAVRTEAARSAGGFSDAPYGEDIEFSHKIRQRGGNVYYAPKAIVEHDERRRFAQLSVEAFRKGQARVRLDRAYRIHQMIHFAPAALTIYLLILPAAMAVISTGAALPLVLYLMCLLARALHASVVMARPAFILALPACALLLHVSYGLGYLSELIRHSKAAA